MGEWGSRWAIQRMREWGNGKECECSAVLGSQFLPLSDVLGLRRLWDANGIGFAL